MTASPVLSSIEGPGYSEMIALAIISENVDGEGDHVGGHTVRQELELTGRR